MKKQLNSTLYSKIKQQEKKSILNNQFQQDRLHDQIEHQNRYLRKVLAKQYRMQAENRVKNKLKQREIEINHERIQNGMISLFLK